MRLKKSSNYCSVCNSVMNIIRDTKMGQNFDGTFYTIFAKPILICSICNERRPQWK